MTGKVFIKYTGIAIAVLLLLWYFFFVLSSPLFNNPLSLVLLDRNGELLGAKIALDGQWRFPQTDSLPEKFAICLTTFEDKRFYTHIGFDLRAIIRAIRQNLVKKEIVSGGSTITMQTIALSEGKKAKNIFAKFIEIIQATRLELAESKDEILKIYASNAPFGGNVVGIDAASWRYFQKDKHHLSWAEYATLAVLPNNPAIIHPGRNRDELKRKRNRLLNKLYKLNHIDDVTFHLATEEPLPESPYALPSHAPHLIETIFLAKNKRPAGVFTSTIDKSAQDYCREIAENYNRIWLDRRVRNLAILVMDTETGEIISYIGNGPLTGPGQHNQVDMIQAKRSSGSLWKPFLYAMALDKGLISSSSLLQDVPTVIDGFRPQNFNRDYRGMVKANEALTTSLNIPFVLLLKDLGLEEFHHRLKKAGISTLFRSASAYGLPLILGGAETTLLESTALFAYLGRMNLQFIKNNSRYDIRLKPASYTLEKEVESPDKIEPYFVTTAPFISAGAAYLTLETLSGLIRPDQNLSWKNYDYQDKIAWKTGTSFGFKDAWAIGVTPKYTVGVWVGNADGEGRPDVIGVQAAAPVLFSVLNKLGNGRWFEKPFDNLKTIEICAVSGKSPGAYCPVTETLMPDIAEAPPLCLHHKPIFYNALSGYRGKKGCPNDHLYTEITWFTLRPMEAYFYKKYNPEFESIPPFSPDCLSEENMEILAIRYPNPNAEIYIPLNLYGEREKVIFEVHHQRLKAKVRWHLNNIYLGETESEHYLIARPLAGQNTLTVVDDTGNSSSVKFSVIFPDANSPAKQ